MKKFIYIIFILQLTKCTEKLSSDVVYGKVYKVENKVELQELTPKLQAGDSVLLAAKEWQDVNLEFKGTGTVTAPITFAAEEAGKTFFTGNSRIEIGGNWLIVSGFVFRNGAITDKGSIVAFRTNSSNLAYNCRLTNVTIDNYNPKDGKIDTKYISLYGTNNRVDNCSFSNKTNAGATLVVWLDKIADNHLIDHNYFGARADLGKNGGETIRIGTSHWESYHSDCIVEHNLFENCDGEIEIISNKSEGNQYRYNTFRSCEGTLTLRHGSDCKVYGNYFFGDEKKKCGGVRVIGSGHSVYNNYFENLRGTSYRAAICLANGVPNSPANRYRQVENAKIAFNTIVNCKEPFAIGAGADEEKSLAPTNSFIENNLIVAAVRNLVKVYSTADGITWAGIFTDADKIGISGEGFIQKNVPMQESGEIQRPTKKNPVIGAAVEGILNDVATDIDGQNRPIKNKDAGCDQLSDDERIIFPMTKENVGAKYN